LTRVDTNTLAQKGDTKLHKEPRQAIKIPRALIAGVHYRSGIGAFSESRQFPLNTCQIVQASLRYILECKLKGSLDNGIRYMETN
jgi:hypothetical protein